MPLALAQVCAFSYQLPDDAQVRVVLPRQNRPELGTGGGVVGRVGGLAHAAHKAAGADKVDGILGPMVPGIGKILRIIHNFDGCARR